ncbi:MAG: hypothetical protein K2H43_07425, partial [Clostridia bacterium]|nr:hypothetical protein [Clostridia bacterium]
TVSIPLAQGQTLSLTVDGNGITTETVEGKAVATFTVTEDHAVSYSVSYAITGTVTGGDEDTAVTIVNANGVKVGGSTGANFSFTVANGTYYVSAQNATMLSNVVTVIVDGGAETAGEIAFTKPIIDEWIHSTNRYAYDYKTGEYGSSENQDWNGGWFAGISVDGDSSYTVETTVKDMPTPTDKYPAAGIMVGTSEGWLRFTVQWNKDNSTYRFVLWRSSDGPIVGETISDPFNGGSMSMKLVYTEGKYQFFVNGTAVYDSSNDNVTVGSEGVRVGLFNDWQITFTDWKFTTNETA